MRPDRATQPAEERSSAGDGRSLEVIGVGLGRTGTTSLAAALERLGVGPCYKEEALRVDAAFWRDAIGGTDVDFDRALGQFRSIVDWPAALLWERLTAHFPAARVVLTIRDPESWYDSMAQALEPLLAAGRRSDQPDVAAACSTWYRIVIEELFDGRFEDRAHGTRLLQRHIAAVKRGVAPDRLLEYDVAHGWGPLCDFLGTPVPAEPFPRMNARRTWHGREMGYTPEPKRAQPRPE